ncbi:MAG: disulfide bond formation protein B [Marivivens sp.]|nr:disulfide bond formation protein B [Marivivens sp.]
MTTSRKTYVILAAGGSAAMLFGAMVVFQRLMDLPPCAMCIWQRWPHAAAVAIGDNVGFARCGHRYFTR